MKSSAKIALFVMLGALMGGMSARADEVLVRSETGWTGLVIARTTGADYPFVVRFDPYVSEVRQDLLQENDVILALSQDGKKNSFISLKGLPLEQAAPLFQGVPGSTLWIKARINRPGTKPREIVAPIQRLATVEKKEVLKSTTGSTGLMIARELYSTYPHIVSIYSESPAAKEGILRPGDEIRAISQYGIVGTFQSVKDMPLHLVEPLFSGQPGTKLWVQARLWRQDTNIITTVPLQRFAFTPQQRLDFERELIAGNPANERYLHELRSRRRSAWNPLPYRGDSAPELLGTEWGLITPGVLADTVIREKGAPQIKLLNIGFGTEQWMYRSPFSTPGATNHSMIYLLVKSGKIQEIALIELP